VLTCCSSLGAWQAGAVEWNLGVTIDVRVQKQMIIKYDGITGSTYRTSWNKIETYTGIRS
jgi:hypothetical protein